MREFNQTVDEIRSQADLKKFTDIIEKQGRKLVLFGAGDCGHVIYNMLQNVGIDVYCFCDNALGDRTDEATGLQIVFPNFLKDKRDQIAVLVCVVEEYAYQAIRNQVISLGIDKTNIYIMRDYYDRLSVAYLEENMHKYIDAYQLLTDDFSRKVFLARMKKVYLMSDISEIVSPSTDEYFDKK